MATNKQQGDRVLVRTAGGYPAIRRLWAVKEDACVVAEEHAYELLKAEQDSPDLSWAVAIPREDVFELPDDAGSIDTREPLHDWQRFRPLTFK